MLPADESCFFLRQDLGIVIIDTDHFCHGAGGTITVTGHHHNPVYAKRMKLPDDSRRFRLQRVFNENDCGQLSFNGQIQMRVFIGQAIKMSLFSFRNNGSFILKNEMIASDAHFLFIYTACDPVRNDIFNGRMPFFMIQVLLLRLPHHCICYGMRIMFFQAGSKAEHLIRICPSKGFTTANSRRSTGQGPGFVKDNRSRFRTVLKGSHQSCSICLLVNHHREFYSVVFVA